mgnify:CR=1 FL=1
MYTKVPINKCQKRLILNTNHGKLKVDTSTEQIKTLDLYNAVSEIHFPNGTGKCQKGN